ncbi:DNA-formamidopyrimidine glycosylase, partial [Bacillus pacificus]|nr:DNA-formamidopyrimidine glycosylase [Bacillus pacificus]
GEEINQMPRADLGAEAFEDELAPQYVQERVQKTNRKIKVLLLGQRLGVGLGNIYVDEVLFRSQVHPKREASSLTAEEIVRIYEATVTT